MPIYTAPVRDTRFILDHVARDRPLFEPAGLRQRHARPGRGDPRPRAARFCEEVLQPLNRVGDEEGCKRNDDGSVTTPPGFKEAWDQFVAGGWTDAVARRRNMAGRGCRRSSSTAIAEYLCSANHSFEMYNGLTQGAIASLLVKGIGRAEGRTMCPTWSPANGPAR